MRSVLIFGVRLDDMTKDELCARLLALLSGSAPSLVVTPNPEFLLAARSSADFREILNSSALSIPDGIALQFAAAAIHGVHNLHRHPGVDVLPLLATMCRDRGVTLVLLGATDNILAQTKMRFTTLVEGISIVTVNPGFIDAESPALAQNIVDELRLVGPCVVAVALGQGSGRSQGKQEFVASQIVTEVPNSRIVMGVGGAFDALSGSVRRAPIMFQRFGFEWLWRLVVEPWRFRRMFRAVILFPIIVAYGTVRAGRFGKALCDVAAELRSHFFSRS